MVQHWNRLLRTETEASERRRMQRADRQHHRVHLHGRRAAVVIVTKFMAGAWIAILAMSLLFVLMKAIHKHYDTVAQELRSRSGPGRGCRAAQPQPRRRSGVQSHCPATLRAQPARATRPDVLEAITVSVDDAETASGAQVGRQRRVGPAQGHRVAVPRKSPGPSSITSSASPPSRSAPW